MSESIYLWPPNPNPESWLTDIPNEGIEFCFNDDYGCPCIVDHHVDYHGCFITEPTPSETIFPDLSFGGIANKEYAQAYGTMIYEFAALWNNPLPKGITLVTVMRKLIKALKKLGWFEIEAVEEEVDGQQRYFRRKE